MKKPHKHAALALEYAKDLAIDHEAWRGWQLNYPDGSHWEECTNHPFWFEENEYRRRPRTITINGIEVPEPLRVAPEEATRYYAVSIDELVLPINPIKWSGDEFDQCWLERGLIHLDEESALTHARALLSFTQENQ